MAKTCIFHAFGGSWYMNAGVLWILPMDLLWWRCGWKKWSKNSVAIFGREKWCWIPCWLVVSTDLKNMLVKLEIFPKDVGVKVEKIFETTNQRFVQSVILLEHDSNITTYNDMTYHPLSMVHFFKNQPQNKSKLLGDSTWPLLRSKNARPNAIDSLL